MSKEMKMSELFPEAFQVEHNKSFEIQDAIWCSYGEKYESNSAQDSAIEYAVLSHDRLTSDLAATQELLRLKELECEQLAKDKEELVEALSKIVAQKDKYTPTQQGKGVRVRRIREFDLDEAKQLLERLG